jgi:hypothetical protein
MKARLYTTTFVLLFSTFAVLTAGEIFRVIAVGGKAEVRKTKSAPWEIIKVNSLLNDSCELRLHNSTSYVGLLMTSGMPIEFSKQGQYRLSDHVFRGNLKTSSALKIISDFVFKSSQSTQKRSVSAVSRDLPEKVQPIFPLNTKLISPFVNLRWEKVGRSTTFVVTVHDNGKPVMLQELQDTSLTINLGKEIKDIKHGQCYYWNVMVKNNENSRSNDFCINILDDESRKKLAGDLDKFMHQARGELKPNESPLAALMVAAWYEKNGFYVEASKYYSKATSMNEVYIPMLEKFRQRIASLDKTK